MKLSHLGSIGDLVQGSGKTGTVPDGDPQSVRKTGVG